MQADLFGSVINMDKMMAKNRQAFQVKKEECDSGDDIASKNDFLQILNQFAENGSAGNLNDEHIKETLQKFIEDETGQINLSELFPILQLNETDFEKAGTEDELEHLLSTLKEIVGQFGTHNSDKDGNESSGEGKLVKNLLGTLSEDITEENIGKTSNISGIAYSAVKESSHANENIQNITGKILNNGNAEQGQINLIDKEHFKNNTTELNVSTEKNKVELFEKNFTNNEKGEKRSTLADITRVDLSSDDSINSNDELIKAGNLKNLKQGAASQLDLTIEKDNDNGINRYDRAIHENESRFSKENLSALTRTENPTDSFVIDSGDDGVDKLGAEKNTTHTTDSKSTTRTHQSRQAEIIRQVVESAKISNNKDHNEITIKLKPEVLGNIRLNISTENHHVTIKVIADSSSVKDILEHNLHHLKAGFVNQGLEIGTFDVMVGDDPQDLYKGHNFSGFQRGRKQSSEQKKGMWNLDGEENEIVTGALQRSDNDKDRIDYYV